MEARVARWVTMATIINIVNIIINSSQVGAIARVLRPFSNNTIMIVGVAERPKVRLRRISTSWSHMFTRLNTREMSQNSSRRYAFIGLKKFVGREMHASIYTCISRIKYQSVSFSKRTVTVTSRTLSAFIAILRSKIRVLPRNKSSVPIMNAVFVNLVVTNVSSGTDQKLSINKYA